MPKLLTCKEVAEYTGLAYATIMGWCRDGKIPATRLGGKSYRISEEDLMQFLDSTKKKHEANAVKYGYKKSK